MILAINKSKNLRFGVRAPDCFVSSFDLLHKSKYTYSDNTKSYATNNLKKYMFSLCVQIRNAEIRNFGFSNESYLHQRTPALQKSNMQNCHP